MSQVDYSTRIPNNVNLADDRRLKRALEAWQPQFLDWWQEMGPAGFQRDEIYLRTAVSVDTDGWAHYDYVKMPEYRWGIFLAPPEQGRTIGFGEHCGAPVWQEVPGELRSALRRIVTIQGDTEPASVEQQRYLGQTCPSLYDLRNILQVNVEEARHLWAMVYLLQAYFGRDGREEAQGLLMRRSGDADKPRILGAFNEKTPDWLSFFMFTFFTDRDGKYQLSSLVESGFDPLARTTRFMLKEEAHHMFVGESGITRIVRRTCEVLKNANTDDWRALGIIPLDMVQRHINFHYSVTLDLFGAEVSTNAASGYASGIKGRFGEGRIDDDHKLADATYA
ncbi:MAG: benzoyl-CoA 2,3-epoxidase subunit BoxB, partial [Gammaproteobacteria bacterium]